MDPFLFRYCPYQPEDEGIYIIKVFAATQARFYWELSYRVMVEDTGVWYDGDYATKMEFNFNATSSTFSLVNLQNEVDLSAACYRCNTITTQHWAALQIPGKSAFWPVTVFGAPYYISDYEGRTLFASGKICDGVAHYECYQTMTDGMYILRLGKGLFGSLLGFPLQNASWEACGESGGVRNQLVIIVIHYHVYLNFVIVLICCFCIRYLRFMVGNVIQFRIITIAPTVIFLLR